ncbi:16S rRNA (cytosine(1402)-N(4))-methyltransferase RsmH [Rhodobacter capsulatus]|uniref:16S rRNA (cytosine(1402)-N(4))-methyltransferase RsmH n=1 Tax=Rhodobacter capsulatus TaxID=1061 RepID=UPI0003D37819|nr:16S rRNA (cytosine(1402)-N(4))-methyltransferase RsmH [Rhodobacter capsulatus]ETD01192.1 16S rRNA methyltransferase [Rhodobacter capsulatus DE442]ETD75776.1 16S rRNA methyltransferase [Rhodobacter capsulatus R121]ETE53057.1 16S rRNA methyltransferase [Rhodobacter capsulatus Y262]MDS0927925.1 16S rRNA (cytosine(1402)-N(4))-methyltransferase RsmH [Rhodobacter capsulatus]
MDRPDTPHIPVLLRPLLQAVAPVLGTWLDGTFGAGGYARGLLAAGAGRVIGIDRDPLAFEMAAPWRGEFGERLVLVENTFSNLDAVAAEIAPEGLDGVVLDLGVSSMQLDQAERGFSFLRDGPLDMRMSQSGPSAADLVNTAEEGALADILYHYGEERASRRIARAIVEARKSAPYESTKQLVATIERCLPRPKPGQSHPATRSFQALRIAVNDEFGQLIAGLEAAERALKPGGKLAVVTFHSLEDRVVKRFFQARAGRAPGGSRYAPEAAPEAAAFDLVTRKGVGPDEIELAQNPRARSAILRIGARTDSPAGRADRSSLGLPAPLFETDRSRGRPR